VTGDGYIAADDVINAINYINAHSTNQTSDILPIATPESDPDSLLLMLAADTTLARQK